MPAQVLDLSSNAAIRNEQYFVDTNVWYWMTYAASKDMDLLNKPTEIQARCYPQYIERAISDGAILCHCPLTFSELANIIENAELQIYREMTGNQHFEKKQFRRIDAEREKVLNEIQIAWVSVNSMSTCLGINLNSNFVENAEALMCDHLLDPFDAYYVQLMRDNQIDYMVTDDHDFCTVNNQIIVTSNPKALK